MKKTIVFVLTIFIMSSCVSTLQLNKQFYNTNKVGVIIQIDSIGLAKTGSQGLLDMALTPGNKFTKPLKYVEDSLKLEDKIKDELSVIFKSNNKDFEFLKINFDPKNLRKFEKPNSDIKYSKQDYRFLKSEYNVDEILFISIKYGILVSYYGVIETKKEGYISLNSEIIKLPENSLYQQENIYKVEKIEGNWKEGEGYENLKTAIQKAIDNSLKELRNKF